MKVLRCATFDRWLRSLRDRTGLHRIAARIDRIQATGHLGDCKYLRDGVSELRFKSGPGYRVYYAQRGEWMILLLCGGDKSTQTRDIERAVQLLAEIQWPDDSSPDEQKTENTDE